MAATVAEALTSAIEHHRAGRLEEAEALYRRILGSVPDHHDAWHLLGLIAHQLERNEEAAQLIGRALALAPRTALFHYHLGAVLAVLQRRAEATDTLRTAIEIDPRLSGPRTELGLCLIGEGRYAEAAAVLREELVLAPLDAVALRNLGVCCYEMGLLEDAEECTRRAVELDPDSSTTWNNLAGILISRGEPEAAAPLYEEAYRRDPGYAVAYSNRLMAEQYLPGVTPERLLDLSLEWQVRYGPRNVPMSRPLAKEDRPLRLGFVSPDLKRAPVGYFLVGLLEALERDADASVVYSDTVQPDDLSERMKQAALLWRDARKMDDASLAKAVHTDGIEVLFDLAGHTKGNRLLLFAKRAAPVQITWAGYVGTTGVEAMDYLLADQFQVPPGAEGYYRERVLRMPHGYVCYVPPSYAPDVAPLPALREGRVTFGAFHNAAKVGEASIAIWSRVMRAVPDAQLVLKYTNLDEPRTKARITGAFASAGIAPERIAIEGISPHTAMLQRYNYIDIALDSIPYSGGLTTCEALWMGVPVVTLPGRTFAGRHSLSHVMNVGHPELVAHDENHYVSIASGLAGNLGALSALRYSLRGHMAASPLCDARGFAKDFISLIRQVTAPR